MAVGDMPVEHRLVFGAKQRPPVAERQHPRAARRGHRREGRADARIIPVLQAEEPIVALMLWTWDAAVSAVRTTDLSSASWRSICTVRRR